MGQLLSDFTVTVKKFPQIGGVFTQFQKGKFAKASSIEKLERISRALLNLIQKEKEPCFLLPATLDFIERVNKAKLLSNYNFNRFELWLNQFSGLDFEANLQVRGKLAGKWVPRDEYQSLFPIGMRKVYEGSHFVTAHSSPDLDSIVSSFWGWLDAFAARVGKGVHYWNVPGGVLQGDIEIDLLFSSVFGEALFSHLLKSSSTLNLTAYDLMTQEGMIKKRSVETTADIDHERNRNAVVIVDSRGHYLGDWRSFDVEGVRKIIMLLNNCLRWFENNLHINIVSLFAKKNLTISDVPTFLSSIFQQKIKDCDPAREYNEKHKRNLNDYLIKVLGVKKGLDCTFEEFGFALIELSIVDFADVHRIVSSIRKAGLFDKSGKVIEDRPKLFLFLEKIIKDLHQALQVVRNYVERADVAMKIKSDVFGFLPGFVTGGADVEEVRNKIGLHGYLSVAIPDKEHFLPMGIVRAADLRAYPLGSVSLRDFCNLQEVRLPPYLEVISVIDHHRSQLTTKTPPMCLISDAQSTNSMLAIKAFEVNDRYSLMGMAKETIEQQSLSEKSFYVLQRLLAKRSIMKRGLPFFVHPMREFCEYVHFLYAILDDTDLLMKVSTRDVECVGALLNRLKSIQLRKEVEIVNFDDLPKDEHYTQRCAERILQNEDMYSLYRKVYLSREKEVAKNIRGAGTHKALLLFSDVKILNGCARVGQTKLFASNVKLFMQQQKTLRSLWIGESQNFYKEQPEIDLHLHMVCTIRGAKEVFRGEYADFRHKDELWIWIPFSELSIGHLKSFLTFFQKCEGLKKADIEVEFFGSRSNELKQIFKESFFPGVFLTTEEKGKNTMAVIRYPATLLNSRKAMISPYLPNLTD